MNIVQQGGNLYAEYCNGFVLIRYQIDGKNTNRELSFMKTAISPPLRQHAAECVRNIPIMTVVSSDYRTHAVRE